MFLIIRLISVVVNLFATVYFIYFMNKSRQPLYFRCVFYGMLAQLLSSVFYLAISTNADWNHDFTLGMFGEIASCLFLASANLRYIPKEYEELHSRISIAGVVAVVMVVAIFALCACYNHTVEFVICDVMYAGSVGLFMYTAADVIRNKYDNAFKHGVKMFNILYALFLLAGSILQLSFSGTGVAFVIIASIQYAVMMIIAFVFGTFSLKKGLEPWEMS